MERLTRLSLAHPRATIAIIAGLSLFALAGLPRLRTEVGYRAYLGSDHPAVEQLDRFIETFGGGLPVMAVWSCDQSPACESVFDDASLEMAHAVDAQLRHLPHVRRVESPASTPIMTLEDEALAIRSLVESGEVVRDQEELARRALQEPLWQGNIVSPDGKVGAIVVQLASSDQDITAAIIPELQAILEPYEARGFQFHLVGDPVDFVIAGGEMQAETPRIIPVMVLLVGVAILFLFRSWVSVVLALATAGLAVAWAMGALAWLGWAQSEVTQPLPPVVLVVGVCAALHVLSRYAARLSQEADFPRAEREGAILAVAREVGPACLITSLTTAAGFLSFATSGLGSFLHLGAAAAWGVLAALLMTFTLLPVILVRLPARFFQQAGVHDAWEDGLSTLVDVSSRHAPFILVATAVAFVVSVLGIVRLHIDVDEQEMFGERSTVVQWARFVEEHLRKADTLEIELVAPAGERIPQLGSIRVVSSVVEYLPTVEGLGRTLSILDLLAPLNQLVHGDDPAHAQPADTPGGNSQLLAALRMDPDSPVDDWLDFEERRARISVEADPVSVEGREEILAGVSKHLRATLPDGWSFALSGPLAVFTEFVQEIQRTQFRSFSTAALVIGAMIFALLWIEGSGVLGAARSALVALISSALPIAIVLGTMGWSGIPLDVATAMVAAIVLGIAVDDSVHLITAYRDHRNRGTVRSVAIRLAVHRVGRALVTTSIALSIGFFSLMMSSWQSIASFGFLSGIAILGALLADLVVLPALILGFSSSDAVPRDPTEITEEPNGRERAAMSLFVLGVIGLALGLAAPSLLRESGGVRLPCLVGHDGVVSPVAALQPECPLEPHDAILSLAVGEARHHPSSDIDLPIAFAHTVQPLTARVKRGGQVVEATVFAVAGTPKLRAVRFGAALLLVTAIATLSLFLVWNSSARAVLPLASVYAGIAVFSIYVICAPGSGLDVGPTLFIAGLLPAAIVHLSLTFPHPRPVLRRSPGLLGLTYGGAFALAVALVWTHREYPTLWRTVLAFGGLITISCWGALLVSLALARRDARSVLERSRARAAFLGTVFLPTALVILGIALDAPPTFVVVGTAAAMPLPIGYAIGRYQRRDIRPHLRQISAYGALLILFGAVLASGLQAFSANAPLTPGVLLLVFFLGLTLSLLLRDMVWEWAKARLPSVSRRLRGLEDEAAQAFHELHTLDEGAQRFAEALHYALRPSGVSVYLGTFPGWRLAAAQGRDPPQMDAEPGPLLEQAVRPIDLGIEGGLQGPAADQLRQSGVAIVAPLRHHNETLGVALVKAPTDYFSYTSRELAFVERLALLASAALQRARLMGRLLQAERYSTVGHIATGLMHDIGKPVTIIRQDAKAALRDDSLPEDHREALAKMRELADDALGTIEQLLDHARGGRAGHHTRTPLREIVERAVDAVSLRHGEGRVLLRLESELPSLEMPDALRLALVNLLDNAILASDPDALTEIVANRFDEKVVLRVIDHGKGMAPDVMDRAFDPFFTTRSAVDGRGIGLSASRTLIEGLGGKVTLSSVEGRGTTVTIEIPAH